MKKCFKRVLALVCAICCFLSGHFIFTDDVYSRNSKSIDENNIALISFKDGKLVTKNIIFYDGDYNFESLLSKREGIGCVVLSDSLKFGFTENFANGNTDGDAYTIEIEYFDEGNGFFRPYYDCMDYGKGFQGQNRYVNYVDDTTYLKDTKTWKTRKIELYNAYFGKRIYNIGKYDLMINVKDWHGLGSYYSVGNVPISEIRITKHPKKNPIHILSETDVNGHIFDWYKKEKIIKNTYTNQSDNYVSCEVLCKIQSNENNITYFEKSEKISFAPRETKSVSLDFGDMQRCGIFNLEVFIKSTDGSIDEHIRPLVFSVIKSDPDGIKNEDMYVASQFERQISDGTKNAREKVEQICDLISRAGFAGSRGENSTWSNYETEKGVYKLSDNSKFIYETLKKYGLKHINMLVWNNKLYMGDEAYAKYSQYTLPYTKTELDGWYNFVQHFINDTKEYGDIYELWNEPAAVQFDNRTPKEPKAYAKLAEVTGKAIRDMNADVICGGQSPAGIFEPENWHYKHMFEVFDLGYPKFLNQVVVHPYYGGRPEEQLSKPDNTFVKIRESYAKNGGVENVRIYATESGTSYNHPTFWGNNSKEVGATNIRFASLAKQKGYLSNYCPYSIVQTGSVMNQNEASFGMLRFGMYDFSYYGKPFTAEAQYIELAAYNYLMAMTEPAGIYDADYNTRIQKFKSKKFNKEIAILNAVEGVDQVTLDLGVNSIVRYDEYGNEETLHSDDGKYDLVVTEIPYYIVGDFKKFETSKDNIGILKYENLYHSVAGGDIFSVDIEKLTEKDLSVEVECDSALELVENNGFGDSNKTRLLIKSSGQAGTNAIALIRIKDAEGKTKSIGYLYCQIHQNVEIKSAVMKIPYITKNSFWQCEIQIKNHQVSKPLSGYLEFKAPTIFSAVGKIDIGNIPAQKTGVVKFNVPNVFQKGIYTLTYDLVTNEDKIYGFASSVDMTIAEYAHKKPVIDGKVDLNEWRLDTQLKTDDISNVTMLIADEVWGGPNDLSATSVIEWDEENFYLLCRVKDNYFWQPYGETETWKGDGIQFGIFYGEEGLLTFGERGQKFNEIGVAKTLNGPKAYRSISQKNGKADKGPLDDYELEINTEGNITTYELRIPWKVLLGEDISPKEGEILKYSFLVNDNDNTTQTGYGRRGYITYADGIGGVKNIDLFSNMQLIKSK